VHFLVDVKISPKNYKVNYTDENGRNRSFAFPKYGTVLSFAKFWDLAELLLYKERMNTQQLIGAVIAFSGLLVLISNGNLTSISFISNYGDLLVLGSAFTWSIYSFYGRKVTLDYPPSLTILYLFLTMFVLLSPVTLSSEFFNSLVKLSTIDWSALIFLGIFCSGVAYVLWAEAMSELPANRVGAFLYLEPFVTVFTAWILLNEEITFLMMASGIVIIIGVIMVNRK